MRLDSSLLPFFSIFWLNRVLSEYSGIPSGKKYAFLLLDFPEDFWHYRGAMQKIEKWRIEELAQVLNQISFLLREGQNAEWANVFSHFAQEAYKILEKRDLELDSLTRLIQNIINCFDGGYSLRSLILRHDNSNRMAKLNQEFGKKRNILSEVLSEMEEKWTESIN